MLRERIRLYRKENVQNHFGADALLLEIQKRNKEKGYFQHAQQALVLKHFEFVVR
ncbi:MAG: hypothetical protein IH823_08375, partial [Candidatus Dadabacteria bacterium]|nr:hypothetical protein [Candidatus Dadabacteria bacterium]